MAFSSILVVLALLGAVLAVENSGMANIGLAFWKNSGFNALYGNSTAMVARIISDGNNIRDGFIVPASNAGIDGDDVNFVNHGTQDITNIERSGANELATMMPQAGCALYDEVIEVPNDDPSAAIYPSCVVVKRCGGCCGHPALACRPTATENVRVQVMKYVYDGSMQPSSVVTHLELESHTACRCGCKVQASDCTPQLHDYSEYSCECVCKNQHLAGSCRQGMRWNPQFCACQCADIQNCGEGYYYDMDTCSCRIGVGNSGSNNIVTPRRQTTVASQVTQQVTEQTTVNLCPHMKCQRGYEATVTSGRCRCRFIRNRK